ncbi:hypothetical protein CEXT_437251 [Caerostris extrusa]|uniref:Uncharacterized protein n=1 Tax=Caerostris extrusa TaxID=172846 RepID=A0AAV4UJE0_CAEEX|nr:hypothetical protein CEXT_437251 [Caerostris extrusa]
MRKDKSKVRIRGESGLAADAAPSDVFAGGRAPARERRTKSGSRSIEQLEGWGNQCSNLGNAVPSKIARDGRRDRGRTLTKSTCNGFFLTLRTDRM